jgi:hypothetical protein
MEKKKRNRKAIRERAENHPTVRLLRELAARIDVELAEGRAKRPPGTPPASG